MKRLGLIKRFRLSPGNAVVDYSRIALPSGRQEGVILANRRFGANVAKAYVWPHLESGDGIKNERQTDKVHRSPSECWL